MNQIRRPDETAPDIARIRAILDGQSLPDFVVGTDIQLDEFDGDPVVWIVFRLTGSDQLGVDEMRRRATILNRTQAAIQDEIFKTSETRYPLFRSEYDEAVRTG